MMDLIKVPLVLLLIFGFVFIVAKLFYKNDILLQKYFFFGLLAKVVGIFLYTIIFDMYYGWGDTFVYYLGAKEFGWLLFENPKLYFEILVNQSHNFSSSAREYMNTVGWGFLLNTDSGGSVVKISSIASVIGLGSYLGTSIVLSGFTYLGSWLPFTIFYKRYRKSHKVLAAAWLFLPSMLFWSSTVTKDTLSIGTAGLITWSIYKIFIERRRFVFALLTLAFNGYVLLLVKPYILVSLLACAIIWIIFSSWDSIKSIPRKKLLYPVYVSMVLGMVAVSLPLVGKFASRYALENILGELESTGNWISTVTERVGGSGYSLGNIEYTPIGVLKVSPRAIFVTFFQPFLWQASKAVVLISAVESLITLLLTVYVLLRAGIFKFLKSFFTNPDVLFCLSFALLFGFFTGLSAMNFGALARYKIPCLPYYFTALIVVMHLLQAKRAKFRAAA